MKPYSPYSDPNGIFRVKKSDPTSHKIEQEIVSEPEGALRNENGKLATTMDQAQSSFQRETEYLKFIHALEAHDCGYDTLYKTNVAQKRALQKIKDLNFQGAREDLKIAFDLCSKIGWISHQFYLEALVAKELGEPDLARNKLMDFLNYASATEPRGYFSVDYDFNEFPETSIKTEREELAYYRENARKYLSGETKAIPLFKTDLDGKSPMMYSNSPFRPGGSNTPGFFIFPTISFSSLTGSIYGASVYKSWGNNSILPTIVSSSTAGTLYGIQLRHGLYESMDRDTNIDTVVYASSWKELLYSYNSYRQITNVQLLREGVNYGGGIGATRRFGLPSLGVSSEIIGEQNTLLSQFRIYGTLYGFYDLARGFDVFSGWIQDQPVSGVSVMFMKIGYNYKDNSIVTFLRGITF